MTDPRHVLALDGEPQTGSWYCARCDAVFAYAADARGYCEPRWGAARIAAVRHRVARLRKP